MDEIIAAFVVGVTVAAFGVGLVGAMNLFLSMIEWVQGWLMARRLRRMREHTELVAKRTTDDLRRLLDNEDPHVARMRRQFREEVRRDPVLHEGRGP